jgi:hypothetical protein
MIARIPFWGRKGSESLIGSLHLQERLKTHPWVLTKSFRCGDASFAHLKPYVPAHTALPDDFSAMVGNDAPELVELVHLDDELKGFSRRQYSET